MRVKELELGGCAVLVKLLVPGGGVLGGQGAGYGAPFRDAQTRGDSRLAISPPK